MSFNAVNFIEALDEALIKDSALQPYRSLLLRDMSSILDEVNLPDTDAGHIYITRISPIGSITVSTRCYLREYISTGKVSSKSWFSREGNTSHSYKDNPGVIYYDTDSSQLSYEEWYKKGKLHRDGGKPAKRTYYNDGRVAGEEWRENGDLHRQGNSALTYYNEETGRKIIEEWRIKGKFHRDGDKPAVTYWYSHDGYKTVEEWYINGQLHRDGNLPALIHSGVGGKKATEEWRVRGKLHRDDGGPALIQYNDHGKVIKEEWHVNGRPTDPIPEGPLAYNYRSRE